MDIQLVDSIRRQLTRNSDKFLKSGKTIASNEWQGIQSLANILAQYLQSTSSKALSASQTKRRQLRKLGEHKYLRLTTGFTLFISAISISSIQLVIANVDTNTGDPILAQYTSQSVSQIPLSTLEGVRTPLDNGILSQGFITGHYALDLRAPIDSAVYPIMEGHVATVVNQTTNGYGKYIIIDHGQQLQSLYAHLGQINVIPGEEVITDDIIGRVGMTGRTTGPHLHLEVIDQGQRINPFILIGGK